MALRFGDFSGKLEMSERIPRRGQARSAQKPVFVAMALNAGQKPPELRLAWTGF